MSVASTHAARIAAPTHVITLPTPSVMVAGDGGGPAGSSGNAGAGGN
jgi:hypothetical protein